MDAMEFFEEWFHGNPLPGVAIWSMPSKKTGWYEDLSAAVQDALHRKGEDVYFGVCGQPKPNGGRGKAEDVTAMHGLWLDVDLGRFGGHKKKHYPNTEGDAQVIFDEFGLQPSISVHSGGGLHSYWCADEIFTINSKADRLSAIEIVGDFYATIQGIAKSHGWDIDSTKDLSRVLRVPETLNMKEKASPRPVRILFPENGAHPVRYTWEVLRLHCHPIVTLKPTTETLTTPTKTLTTTTETLTTPDFIRAMCEADKKFNSTWHRRRHNLVDQSFSSYDMALADLMVTADCTDEQISEVILAFRARHGTEDDIRKGKRKDYISRTIARARSIPREPKRPVGRPPARSRDEEPSLDSVADISTLLGIPIEVLVKQGSPNSHYALHLESGEEVWIGTSSILMDQRKTYAKIMDACGILPPKLQGNMWSAAINVLLANRQDIEDIESDPMKVLSGCLSDYLSEFPPSEDDYNRKGLLRQPILREDKCGISAEPFRQYCEARGAVYSDPEIRKFLRLTGFENRRDTFRPEKKNYCRAYWWGPIPVEEESDDA